MKAVYLLAGSIMALALAAPALAQVATAQNGGTLQGAAQTSTDEERNEDIIVTAQKRDQTLIEVPQSISVIGGDTLERQQARSFLDYAQLVPGLNVTQDNPGQSRLTLRGINTGSPGSTVAVYVDDAPFGASGSLSNGATLAGDFDTFDVARIEVLRGPQRLLQEECGLYRCDRPSGPGRRPLGELWRPRVAFVPAKHELLGSSLGRSTGYPGRRSVQFQRQSADAATGRPRFGRLHGRQSGKV